MHFYTKVSQNWLTQKPRYSAFFGVAILAFFVLALTLLDWADSETFDPLLRATWNQVFDQHQYYRLWTSLFIHADSSHLFSNMVFFVPLLYLLSSYYGSWLWPLYAVFVGGIINAIVLQTIPPDVALIGISGVDNWLGAVWLTLFFLIDRRQTKRHRSAVVIFITFVLFVPDTYKPGVSYLSHLMGYLLGIISAAFFYIFNRKHFSEVEVIETIQAEDLVKVSPPETSNF